MPKHAFPNAMQAYMLGARNYFMRPKVSETSVYKHAARPVFDGPDGNRIYPRVNEDEVEILFPDLINGSLPADDVTIDYTARELWNDFPRYYSSEFNEKWSSGKLNTPGRWMKLAREFPLHSRFD